MMIAHVRRRTSVSGRSSSAWQEEVVPCYIGNWSQELFSSLVISPRGQFVQQRATALLFLNAEGSEGWGYRNQLPGSSAFFLAFSHCLQVTGHAIPVYLGA